MSHRYPSLRPYASGDVWAQTAAQASAFDARAIRDVGVPQPVLMENAGRSAAALLNRLYPTGPVLGVVGAGNNGGDALVLLRTLRAWGREVAAVLVADRPADDPLLHGWSLPVYSETDLGDRAWDEMLAKAGVVVDGVLGTGVQGPARERQAAAIERVNASGSVVLAIDVPSGIDASTGATPGAAIKANVTVAFGAPKLGALLHPARALVGRHVVVEIGFPPMDADARGARVVVPSWARAKLPTRETDTHKNAVGRALIVAGQPGMGGAAVLCAQGAFRAGAGLVRVASAPENREALHAAVPDAIFVDATDAAAVASALDASDALAAGPGLGTGDDQAALLSTLASARALPTVLDADALNLFAGGDGPSLADIGQGRPLLITPHPGEMSRLLSDAGSEGGHLDRAREASVRFSCAVLLKGAPSVVAHPVELSTIDTQSSSDLAVAGMGDVLTGVCVALMAQGLEPHTAGAVGLYLSGRAARIAGRGAGLTPSDVVRWLPDALVESTEPSSDLGFPFVTFDADAAS